MCCKEANHISCELQCLTTKDVKNLKNENCDAIREPKLAQCVLKVHASKVCCDGARAGQCKHACMQYFKTSRLESVLKRRKDLEMRCGKNSKQYTCAMKKSKFKGVMHDLTKCCVKGDTKKCKWECKKAFQNSRNFSLAFSMIRPHCGRFNQDKPLYKCIVRTTSVGAKRRPTVHLELEHRTNVLIDKSPNKFKEQCCARAISPNCKAWCTETIESPNLMGLWDVMYVSCIQNPKEVELSSCMSDILEPCEIGGENNLKFCTNFNNRPMELFRHCNRYGDSRAQKLHKYWSDSLVPLLQHHLVFKDIKTCKPEMFKAMACLLVIKPCHHQLLQRQVCRSDCEELLDSCLDRTQTDMDVTVKTFCAAFLPNNNQTGCISVHDYIGKPKSKTQVAKDEVSLPCASNPCKLNEMCMINRACERSGNPVVPCTPYKCVKGCSVSSRSKLLIPVDQMAKLRIVDDKNECYSVCECMHVQVSDELVTYFGRCQEFGCYEKQNCTFNNQIKHDGEIFSIGCNNTCTCDDGKLICSDRLCKTNERLRRHHITGKNALESPYKQCTKVYNPVCGVNGMTYPNVCFASRRMEDHQLTVGDCQSVDPCDPDPCTHGLTCISKRNVCLTSSRHCPQYTCSMTVRARYLHTVSCNINDLEMETSYVCGFDGVTYRHECVAEDAGTGVDYEGRCEEKIDSCKKVHGCKEEDRCKKVTCRKIDSTNCVLITPPGACCQVCGSLLHVLYSERDLQRHLNYISYDPMTVAGVVKHMRQLLKVIVCRLYGHLTVDKELLIMVIVNSDKPTRAQVHACSTEAERFQKYINNRSPVMHTNYYLSVLKASRLKSASWKKIGSSSTLVFNRMEAYTMLMVCTLLSILLTSSR